MNTYVVITAEVNGCLKTGLVSEDDFDGNASQYFLPGAENIEVHGTVEISGEAAHMLPAYLVEE